MIGPGTGFATYSEADRQLAFAEPNRASSFRLNRLRKPLGEDPAQALWIGASKPSCVEPDFDNPPLPGQIDQPAHVVTVDAAGSAATTWTARVHRLRPSDEQHTISLRANLDNRKLG